MQRWSGRVSLVTGAGSGIGAAIAKEMVRKGMRVVGLDLNVGRVEDIAAGLTKAPGELHSVKADVTKEEDILSAFQWIRKNLGGVDVLINNAGVSRRDAHLVDGLTEKWRQTLQTNLLAPTICTREAIKSMRERGVDDGHIIHINGVAGHKVPFTPGIGIYSASKYGITALTEALRIELNTLQSRIRVTSISPGMVKTEIFSSVGGDFGMDFFDSIPHLKAEDIADAVAYVLGAPPHVQIHELTIKPVGENY